MRFDAPWAVLLLLVIPAMIWLRGVLREIAAEL